MTAKDDKNVHQLLAWRLPGNGLKISFEVRLTDRMQRNYERNTAKEKEKEKEKKRKARR